MLLSVVIPVYNAASYLQRCVNSVCNQTYQEIEIILVNDGSNDNSGALCDELAQKDTRIRVVHQKNSGSSAARNAGIQCAKGDYIVFLDADDYWIRKDGVEQIMICLAQSGSDIFLFKQIEVYPNSRFSTIDYDLKFIYSHSAQEIFEQQVYSERFHLGVHVQLWKKSLIEKNGISFPVGVISGEDTDFSCRAWQKAKTVGALNLEMYAYCHHSNTITTSYSIRNLCSYEELFVYWNRQISNQCINYRAIGMLLANLYVSACYNYYSISIKDRKLAKQILLKHQGLLSYSGTKKSHRMQNVVRVVGIRCGIFLFASYGLLKKIL